MQSDVLDTQEKQNPSSSSSEEVRPGLAASPPAEQVSCQLQSPPAHYLVTLRLEASRRLHESRAEAAELVAILVVCGRLVQASAAATGTRYLDALRPRMQSLLRSLRGNRLRIAQSLLLLATIVLLVGFPGSASLVASRAAHVPARVPTPANTSASAVVPRIIQASVSGDVNSLSADTGALSAMSPVRLIIPKMGLNAKIDGLGPSPTGAMQAPQPSNPNDPILRDVYWWDVGALPGQDGNAVIAGHINRPDGSPATFGNLDLLNPGDQFQVITADGTVLTFAVTATDDPLVYVHGGNDPTIQRIFGPSSSPHLNLLTCWGTWDGTQYNRRLVVYSTLVDSTPPAHAPNVPAAP